MTHQANNVESIVNAHILKQTIEQGLKALGAVKVEFNQYIFNGHPKKAVMVGLYGAPEGRIDVWWPDNRKATIQLDFLHVEHILKVENARGIQDYAKSVIRNIITDRLEDSLKGFSVSIPINIL